MAEKLGLMAYGVTRDRSDPGIGSPLSRCLTHLQRLTGGWRACAEALKGSSASDYCARAGFWIPEAFDVRCRVAAVVRRKVR